MTQHFLTDNDVDLIRQVAKQILDRREQSASSHHQEPELGQNRQIRMVLTPNGGIPGAVGTTPGIAACQGYRLDRPTGAVAPVGQPFNVYNMSTVAVKGGLYVTAERDPEGVWWVPSDGRLSDVSCVNNQLTRTYG